MTKKVLVVDDQAGIRILLVEVLQKEGYKAYSAATGKEALRIVDEENPDLIILDMKIPGMDGLEILTHLKANNPDIKVIIMTAYGELNMINEAKEIGAVSYFLKPFDINEMRKSIRMELC